MNLVVIFARWYTHIYPSYMDFEYQNVYGSVYGSVCGSVNLRVLLDHSVQSNINFGIQKRMHLQYPLS